MNAIEHVFAFTVFYSPTSMCRRFCNESRSWCCSYQLESGVLLVFNYLPAAFWKRCYSLLRGGQSPETGCYRLCIDWSVEQILQWRDDRWDIKHSRT